MLSRIRRATGAAAVLIPLLLLAACSHSGPTTAPARATLAYCGGEQQAHPTVVNVICTTNDITARNLTWSGWGKPFAVARGTAVVDLCAFADCHSGSCHPFPILLIASKIASCGGSPHAYHRLQYVFVGRSPFQGLAAHLKFTNFMVGSARPGPPPHQTVSLS
jgi:hypothetical protein